jgi:hypothetical protein
MIQNLANDLTEFKEPFMIPLNSFLTSNLDRIRSYYDNVSVRLRRSIFRCFIFRLMSL